MLIYVCILIMDEVLCPQDKTKITNKVNQLESGRKKVAWF
jgi:hypothetical protein